MASEGYTELDTRIVVASFFVFVFVFFLFFFYATQNSFDYHSPFVVNSPMKSDGAHNDSKQNMPFTKANSHC